MAVRVLLVTLFLVLMHMSGVRSQSPCDPNPCLNGGTCLPFVNGSYTCECPLGCTGVNCEISEITLTCTAIQMIVDIPKSLLTSDTVGEDARWWNANQNDTDCWGTWVNDTGVETLQLTTNLTGCGTNMTETPWEEIYTNSISNNYIDGSLISRDYVIDIWVRCAYNRSKNVGPLKYVLTDYTIYKKLSAEGRYNCSFYFYYDYLYSIPYHSYPITIGLDKSLYFGASVLSLGGTLDMALVTCWATPTDDYTDTVRYTFIENGVSIDPQVNITYVTGYFVGVSLKTFRFIDLGDWVYIHCNLYVCDAHDNRSLCNEYRYNNTVLSGRRRRDVSSTISTERITRGPLFLNRAARDSISNVEKSDTMGDRQLQQEVTSVLSPWVVAMVGMATVVMTLAAVLVVMMRKVNRIAATSEKRSPKHAKEDSFGLLQDPAF